MPRPAHRPLAPGIGRQVIVVKNLAPRTIFKLESHGMILAVDAPDGGLALVQPSAGVKAGTRVTFSGSFALHPFTGGEVVGLTLLPASSGPFAGSPVCRDGAAGAIDGVPVDLFIPGCPPHPVTILDGLLRLLGSPVTVVAVRCAR